MAFNWKEFAVNVILPTVESLAEPQFEILLNKVAEAEAKADNGAANFALDLQALDRILIRMKAFAEQSQSKIDDGIVGIFIDAVHGSAGTNGVELPG